jgi:predicted nucleic-acid-binding protein
MISVDTNVIVRLLTGDDKSQFEKAKALFLKENIFVTTTVILECEWVLRYAYNFEQSAILNAFQSLFGLPNVHFESSEIILSAIEWCQSRIDFADALHLAQSKEADAFVTFDKKLIKTAL